MILYAIRRKSDGAFLLNHKYPSKYGPGELCATLQPLPPRFHVSKKIANMCLAQWLRGEHGQDWEGEDGYILHDPDPRPERKREDMEVVKVIVSIKK